MESPSEPPSPAARRRVSLTARVLEEALDDELQAIVAEAARSLGVPIALVALMLQRIQFFRAFHGLSPDLAAVRGTLSKSGFCQFVVQRGAPVAIEDAAGDPSLPQELVEQYGIRAYLGMPVRVEGELLGTLCVIDTTPRHFDDADRERLAALADRVQSRLTRLAASRTRAPLGLIEAAVAPVFAELRNELVPIQYGVEGARIAAFELRTLLAAVEMGAEAPYLMHHLAPARNAMSTLRTQLDAIDEAADKMLGGIRTLENAASTAWDDATVADVWVEANALSRHMTQLIGGVVWHAAPSQRIVALPLPIASALLAAVLSWLTDHMRARRLPGPIEVEVRERDDELAVVLRVEGLDADDISAVRRRFTGLGIDRRVRLDARPDALVLVLPARTPRPA